MLFSASYFKEIIIWIFHKASARIVRSFLLQGGVLQAKVNLLLDEGFDEAGIFSHLLLGLTRRLRKHKAEPRQLSQHHQDPWAFSRMSAFVVCVSLLLYSVFVQYKKCCAIWGWDKFFFLHPRQGLAFLTASMASSSLKWYNTLLKVAIFVRHLHALIG